VTHTLIGLDSRRVFSFLASIKAAAARASVSKDNGVEHGHAQVRNEILVRGEEIQAELAKDWSAAAIWKVLTKNKEISCSYKTFVAHVRRPLPGVWLADSQGKERLRLYVDPAGSPHISYSTTKAR
jgi:hypothetical protein